MSEYQKRLEEFRFHYFTTYGVKLDDEVLYFFIRVNEMQSDLKKQINEIPKLTYPNGWDYFMHGLGRITITSILICFGLTIALIVSLRAIQKDEIVITKDGASALELKLNGSSYYLSLKKIP